MSAGLRVLIADDHAVVRQGIRGVLEEVDGLEVVAEASDGEEALALTREHVLASAFFRRIDVEIDTVAGAEGVLAIGTGDHPNRPLDLPSEALDVEEAFRRAGLEVRVTRDQALVPLADAGDNQTWDDAELHDAMQS